MLRSVPTGISDFLGTTAVSTISSERLTNLTWLPFWIASTKPADSRRRLTTRKGCGLSRPNLNLNHTDLGRASRLRRFKVKFEGFLQIGERLFFSLALAGNINL